MTAIELPVASRLPLTVEAAMRSMRSALGVAIGTLLAFAGLLLSDVLTQLALPEPSRNDGGSIDPYLSTLPPLLLVTLCTGWAASNLVGSLVATLIAGRGPAPGWIVTGVLLATTATLFVLDPHPYWLSGLVFALIVAAGGFGSRIGANIRR